MIRTYKRKRTLNKVIKDVHELCRLCLNKSEVVVPIFSKGNENEFATLAVRITICTGLEVSQDDSLPNMICKECYNQLERYYSFRKRCEVTYQKLKSHLLAVKVQRSEPQIENKNITNNNVVDSENVKFIVTFNDLTDSKINSVIMDNTEKQPHVLGIHQQQVITLESNNEVPIHQESDNPDISTFLTAMLLQLGIISQQDDSIAYLDSNVSSFELETGDGSQVLLELVEEEDQEQMKPLIEAVRVADIPPNIAIPPTIVEIPPKVVEIPPTIVEIPHTIVEIPPNKVEVPPTIVETPSSKEQTGGSGLENVAIKYITSYNKVQTEKSSKAVTNYKSGLGAWCPQCGRRLASRSALARHMRTHSGVKPYCCDHCGRAFRQKEVMIRHRLVHTDDRPFKCTECPKSFTQRAALRVHSQTHKPIGARAFQLHRCPHCPKLFLYASGLCRHMLIHSGRQYVCGGCERSFNDKSSLMRHLKTSHHTTTKHTELQQAIEQKDP